MNGEKGSEELKLAGGAHDKTILNQIMLRFRPIAPKPAKTTPFSGDSKLENKQFVTIKRIKRKYVKRSNIKRSNYHQTAGIKNKVYTTLELLPVITGPPAVTSLPNNRDFYVAHSNKLGEQNPDRAVEILPPRRVVETWVTLESVTSTCVEDERWLDGTDGERVTDHLEGDACPGFVSDGFGRVVWVNLAYRRMVVGADEACEVVVWLVVKETEKFPVKCKAFSCRVRVVYKEKQCFSIIVPCDVWRRKTGGGFVWRLDVEAALSLGPLKQKFQVQDQGIYQVTG